MNRKLPRSFYNRPTLQVARDLLGKIVCFHSHGGILSARIVEVEAYIGEDDPACHASPGPTKRNQIMYGKPGVSYVYFIYGMYHCFNVVTEREGFPAAVLVRAAEPLDGIDLMKVNSPRSRSTTLLSGPGKFCRAFGLTASQSGVDLTGIELFLCDSGSVIGDIIVTRRIGIKKGETLPYRFFIDGSPAVSGPPELRAG